MVFGPQCDIATYTAKIPENLIKKNRTLFTPPLAARYKAPRANAAGRWRWPRGTPPWGLRASGGAAGSQGASRCARGSGSRPGRCGCWAGREVAGAVEIRAGDATSNGRWGRRLMRVLGMVPTVTEASEPLAAFEDWEGGPRQRRRRQQQRTRGPPLVSGGRRECAGEQRREPGGRHSEGHGAERGCRRAGAVGSKEEQWFAIRIFQCFASQEFLTCLRPILMNLGQWRSTGRGAPNPPSKISDSAPSTCWTRRSKEPGMNSCMVTGSEFGNRL